MSLTPRKHISELIGDMRKPKDRGRKAGSRRPGGLMAVSPLLVFLLVYVLSSVAAGDFYKVPITAAFLVASVYAVAIGLVRRPGQGRRPDQGRSREQNGSQGQNGSQEQSVFRERSRDMVQGGSQDGGNQHTESQNASSQTADSQDANNQDGVNFGDGSQHSGSPAGSRLSDRVAVFSRGAGERNVLLMLWIFILAGAFAGSARAIGAVDATVNLTLRLLPGQMLLAGLFLAACFISMAVGTSVGTIVALVPIAAGIAPQTGVEPALLVGIIVGGAFFGDNLSFISDTTIAATKTQGCEMADKFKANLWIALPAALAVAVLYLFLGRGVGSGVEAGAVKPLLVLPYLLVIVLAVCGMDVLAVLVTGIVANALIGILGGTVGWIDFLKSCGDGIASMGELIIVTMLAGGLLEIIRHDGGLDWLIRGLTRHISGRRGAELSITALVSLVNVCTANNTIAIITSGPLAREITERFKLDPRRTASILDTFSCLIQGILPYGAQMLMASGLAGIAATAIIPRLYYPFALGVVALLAILLQVPKKYNAQL